MQTRDGFAAFVVLAERNFVQTHINEDMCSGVLDSAYYYVLDSAKYLTR